MIVGRQNNDVSLINEVLANSFNTMVKSISYIFLCLAYLLWLNAKLVGILFAGLAFMSIVSGGLRRVTSKLNDQYLAEKAKLAHISEEVFSNIRTVKAFHNDNNEIEKYRAVNKRIIAIGKRRAVWSGIFQTISYALMYGTLVAVTYAGSMMAMNKQTMTSGQLVQFLFLLLSVIASVVLLALNLSPLF